MRQWLNNLLSAEGSVSAMRFMCLMCTTTACIIGIVAVWRNSNLEMAAMLVSPFLTAGITGKLMQKKIETAPEVPHGS
jgi:hypothetical protein